MSCPAAAGGAGRGYDDGTLYRYRLLSASARNEKDQERRKASQRELLVCSHQRCGEWVGSASHRSASAEPMKLNTKSRTEQLCSTRNARSLRSLAQTSRFFLIVTFVFLVYGVEVVLHAAAESVSGPGRAKLTTVGNVRGQVRVVSDAVGDAGLPMGSHNKVAGVRRKWTDRRAAMQQALRFNSTLVELKPRIANASIRENGGEASNQSRLSAATAGNSGGTFAGGIELIINNVASVLGLISRGQHPDSIIMRSASLRVHNIFDSDSSQRIFHPAALVPFQKNPRWLDAAVAATTETWRGYGREPAEDGSTPESSANYQKTIKDLVEVPLGGIKLNAKYPAAQRPGLCGNGKDCWSWNSPATGGLELTVFGMGFGWNPALCSDECLASPSDKCPDKTCNYLEGSIGETVTQSTKWLSDSSLSMIVPSGMGFDQSVNVTIGRFKNVVILEKQFSYDAPSLTAIKPGNSPTVGGISVTVWGKNFGAYNEGNDHTVQVGFSDCTTANWISDSSVVCATAIRGTGSLLNTQLKANGRPAENPFGVSRVFSYDKPEIYRLQPANAPPSGFTVVTIIGKNFGSGPDLTSARISCPLDSPGLSWYVLKPLSDREAICASGFMVDGGRFSVMQNEMKNGNPVPDSPLVNLRWDNIRPFSMAYDPIACIINEYLCSARTSGSPSCRFMKESCIPISNATVSQWDAKYLASPSPPLSTGATRPVDSDTVRPVWYTLGDKEGGCTNLPDSSCPPRVVSRYLKDGVNCDLMDTREASNVQPHFKKNKIFTTDYLCAMSPRFSGACNSCSKLGCCNKKGTFGARVAATECVTLRWLSDSSMACRLAPGIGQAHDFMLAIDDYEGAQLVVKERAISFDAPTISAIERLTSPTTGGTLYGLRGQDFGTFSCNRSWCSYDADLLLCNTTGCSRPGEPDRSQLISQYASLQAAYDLPSFRTSCARVKWTSDTALSCTVAPGTGDLRVIELTVFRNRNVFAKDLVRDVDRSFRYKAPSVYRVNPTNLPANPTVNVTIFGNDFGLWDTKPKARVAGTACIQTFWSSDTIITCLAPRGLQNPPCISGPGGIEAANTEAGCRTVFCDTCTDGYSKTACERPYDTHPQISGQGICKSIVVTVDRLRGWLTDAFTYESHDITALYPSNGPPVGNFNVTVQGINFGDQKEYGFSGAMGDTACAMTWQSDTSILCLMKMGISYGHAPRVAIGWNKQIKVNKKLLFTYDGPQLNRMVPMNIPASGGIPVSVFGQNFGAFPKFEFPQNTLLPLPPKSKLGDTPCSSTKWWSDSVVVCQLMASGTGPGAGVGGFLPMYVEVGSQTGIYQKPDFGYTKPSVKQASANNSPEQGGLSMVVIGENFGTFDFSPKAAIGLTDCKLTRWLSNTAVECTVPRCTTYLGGGNLELPVSVVVGLGHRTSSFQSGALENYFFYDEPVLLQFQLSTTEINILAFAMAFVLAGLVIFAYHHQYRKNWRPPQPSLPERYSKVRPDLVHQFKPSKKAPAQTSAQSNASEDDTSDESESSGSEQNQDPFYEFTGEDKKGQKASDADDAFKRGQEAAMLIATTKNDGKKYHALDDDDDEAGQPEEKDASRFSLNDEAQVENMITPKPARGIKKIISALTSAATTTREAPTGPARGAVAGVGERGGGIGPTNV